MKRVIAIVGALLLAASSYGQTFPGASGNPSVLSRPGGGFYAPAFLSQTMRVLNGNSATGSATITIVGSTGGIGGLQLPDGTTLQLQTVFNTLTPIIIDYGQGAAEYVTPTAVSVGTCPAGNLGVGGVVQCVTFTGTFSNTHGQDAVVIEGTYGLQTAVNYAQQLGGGVVTIDPAWAQMAQSISSVTGGPASVNAMISALIPYSGVSISDIRNSAPQYWNAGQSTASFLAAPTTLTSTTVGFGINGANTTGGAYTGTSTYHVCIAYVDVAGQEGPCSSDFSGLTAGTGSTNQIGIAAPAASTGAVGYVVYISLASGSYALAYQAPLTSTTCTLTKIETVTPACAVANTTYNQTGSNAIIGSLTVNTAPLATLAGGTNNQYTGNSNGRTTYAYTPSTRLAANGITFTTQAFTATAGTVASTNPVVLGTINLPAGFMNYVGKMIRVCGKYKGTPSGTTTIENIQLYWDAGGSDSAGTPVQIANIQGTATFTNVVYNGSFCETLMTTVAGSGATAGSIIGSTNLTAVGIASAPTNLVTELDTLNSATASLNLANTATPGYATHLHVVQNHTTGSDGAFTLLNLTVEVL